MTVEEIKEIIRKMQTGEMSASMSLIEYVWHTPEYAQALRKLAEEDSPAKNSQKIS